MTGPPFGRKRARSQSRERASSSANPPGHSNRAHSPRRNQRPPPGFDRNDHNRPRRRSPEGGRLPPPLPPPTQPPGPRRDLRWVQRHYAYCHESGCSICDDFYRHIVNGVSSDPQLATMIAQASLSRPEDTQRRIDDLDRQLREANRRIDETERRAADLRRGNDELKRERDYEHERNRVLTGLTRPTGGSSSAEGSSSTAINQEIERLRTELATTAVTRDNYRAHANELMAWVLRSRHNVTASSSTPDTAVRPYPYFTITPTDPGTTPRLAIPLPDDDVVMGNTAHSGYTDRLFALNEQGAIAPWARDPYESLEYEDDEVPDSGSDGTIEANSDDSVRPSAKRKGKGKARANPTSNSREDTRPRDKGKGKAKAAPPTSFGTAGSSRAPVVAPTVPSPTPPLPWTESGEVQTWRNLTGTGWGITLDTNSNSEGGGGTSTGSNETPQNSVASYGTTEVHHPPFNGVEWVARRLNPVPVPASASQQERRDIMARAGRNRARPTLSEGEIPPLFVELNTINEQVLQNLFERAEDQGNPGARDSAEILGELNNASARARKPRHPLEDFVVKKYKGKPTWAKETPPSGGVPSSVSISDTLLLEATAVTNSNTIQTSELPVEIAHNSSIPPTTEDVHMTQDSSGPGIINIGTSTDSSTSTTNRGGGNDTPSRQSSGPSGNMVQNIPNPPAPSLSTTDPGELLFPGLNPVDYEAVRDLRDLFLSADSPLTRPTLDVWEELLVRYPHLQLFGIQVNNLADLNSQFLHGFLSILQRIPSPRSPERILVVLQALRTRWLESPGFIRGNTGPVTSLMTTSELSSVDQIVAHFTNHGIGLEEHLDVCALLGFIARPR
ncbi:hypothetical protein QCA50_012427 [Cerrena zonata]|uniref:Uncharacterized protein n=1 Tax=Cerrena zonata TaxID=2478898 RepID=A0AAW0FT17_9APHY